MTKSKQPPNKRPTPPADACPDAETLLQALNERRSPQLLDHVSHCPACLANQELQETLEIWRQLDSLTPIKVSDTFEARLRAKLVVAEAQYRRWLLIDMWFNWLHLPALAAMVGLCFWLPPPPHSQLRPQLERRPYTTRPQLRQDLSVEQGLTQLRELYQRRVDG